MGRDKKKKREAEIAEKRKEEEAKKAKEAELAKKIEYELGDVKAAKVEAHGIETKLHAKHSGLYLDIASKSTTPGAHLCQAEAHDGPSQIFILNDLKDGTWEIISKSTDLLVSVNNGEGNGGAIFQQKRGFAGESDRKFQKWVIKNHEDGSHRFVNAGSGRCLDVAEVSKAPGAKVHQWEAWEGDNQKWLASGFVGHATRLKAKHSGLYLDIADSNKLAGAHVCQTAAHDGTSQIFLLRELKEGVYEIGNLNSHHLLSVNNGDKSGGPIFQQRRHFAGESDAKFQRWAIKHHSDGSHRIQNEGSGLSIDVSEGSKSSGAKVFQWESHDGDNQRWVKD